MQVTPTPTRSLSLGMISDAVLRSFFGTTCLSAPGLAIGTAKTKVLIANTVAYLVDGVFKAKTTAEIVFTDLTVQAANTTKFYAVSLDAAGNGLISAGTGVLTAALTAVAPDTNPAAQGLDYPGLPKLADGQCLIGAIKVVTGATTFTPGTDNLDKASVTTTYYDLAYVPAAGLTA